MATALQAQVQALLERRLTEEKSSSVPAAELEVAAVIETVAMTLYLYPRVALYLAHLARNGLAQAVSQALTQVASVRSLISDLGNQSYALKDTSALQSARVALLQLEQQGAVSSSNSSLSRFEKSVDLFLEKQLAKNVRKKSGEGLVRTRDEAKAALPAAFASLKSAHADILDRLAALLAGIPAFEAAQGSSLIAVNTAFRVREDIEAIIAELANDPSAAGSTDYLMRLMSAKTSLRLLSDPPSWSDPIIDTGRGIPNGTIVGATVEATSVIDITPLGNSVSGPVSVTTPAGTVTNTFPAGPGGSTASRAFLGGAPAAWPATIPAGGQLFLRCGTTYLRVPLNPGGSPISMSLSAVKVAINAAAWAYVDVGDFLGPTTGRLLLVAKAGILELEVLPSVVESVSGVPVTFSVSAAAALGLSEGALAHSSVLAPEVVQAFFEQLGVPDLEVSIPSSGVIRLSHGPAVMTSLQVTGLPGTWAPSQAFGTASLLRLYGSYRTSTYTNLDGNALPAADHLDSGDQVSIGGNDVLVTGFSGRRVVLSSPLPSIVDEAVVVTSALTLCWQGLSSALSDFAQSWGSSGFAKDLDLLDRVVAPLYASATPARRDAASAQLQLLEVQLQALQDVLEAYPLAQGAATSERQVGDSLVATLRERKLDRATDALLRCKLVQVFSMNWQTASYSGELMASMSDVAANDITWPNRSVEDVEAHASDEFGGDA